MLWDADVAHTNNRYDVAIKNALTKASSSDSKASKTSTKSKGSREIVASKSPNSASVDIQSSGRSTRSSRLFRF